MKALNETEKQALAAKYLPRSDIDCYHYYVNEHPELKLELTDAQVAEEIVKIKLRDQKCEICYVTETRLKRCTRCYLAFYCSVDHQKQHWSYHKKRCRNINGLMEYGPNSIMQFEGDEIKIKFQDSFESIDNLFEIYQETKILMDDSNTFTKFLNDGKWFVEGIPNTFYLMIFPSVSAFHRRLCGIIEMKDDPAVFNFSKEQARNRFKCYDDDVINAIDQTNYCVTIAISLNSRFGIDVERRTLRMMSVMVPV